MPLPNIILAGTNFTNADSLSSAFSQFVADRSMVWTFVSACNWDDGFGVCVEQYWSGLLEWLSQPRTLDSPLH